MPFIHVGNIFYAHGLAIITNQDYQRIFPLPPVAINNSAAYFTVSTPKRVFAASNDYARTGTLNTGSIILSGSISSPNHSWATGSGGSIILTTTTPGTYEIWYTIGADITGPCPVQLRSNKAKVTIRVIPFCELIGTATRCAPAPPLTPNPTPGPTPNPTPGPTPNPTPGPTSGPTPNPTPGPTSNPTPNPTPGPTPNPTPNPTPGPTPNPTPSPTPNPTPNPTPAPTAISSGALPPSGAPVITPCSVNGSLSITGFTPGYAFLTINESTCGEGGGCTQYSILNEGSETGAWSITNC
jgi:hypothetical protein